MRYKILKDGEIVNTIIADEAFVIGYCEKRGYTYKEIPEPSTPELKPEPTTEEILLEMAADHEERLCMMELGI